METSLESAGSSVRPVAGVLSSRLARVDSVDVLRGLIIIIMALDHVRDFFGDLTASPTNLTTTTAGLFFTRWATHICAPVFFLLTGVSAFLTEQRLPSKGKLARYLVTRGLWLIFLEAVVMRFALTFNLDYQVTILTVLWALGWAMIVLAGLIWLPTWAIALIGGVLVLGHNALDGVRVVGPGPWASVWSVLHAPGVVFNSGHSLVVAAYVLIPWVGVTALGYVLGAVYRWDPGPRQRFLLWLAVGAAVGFVLLRFVNIYGDPLPWSPQRTPLWTLMSFLNTNKYPPSLLFLLMTLAPALLLLRIFDSGVPALLRYPQVIGKVPLFFYVVHFYLIHLLAVAASSLRYGRVDWMFQAPDLAHFPFSQPAGWGSGLPVIYVIWVAVVLMLFPACRWYAELKGRRRWWWMSYL